MPYCQQVLTRARLSPEDEIGLSVFTCFGNDPIHKGSLYLRTGAIVGLPPTFHYQSTDDINKEELRAGGRYIDWDSDAAKKLSNAMVLTDKAKAFAIAREINYACTYHVYVDSILKAGFLMMAYSAGFMINRKFGLKQRMRIGGRGGVYSMLGIVASLMYMTISDTYTCWRDNSVDKRTANMGWAYAEGGLEFYLKSLERNVALRELMRAEGKVVYTAYGNDVSTVRRSTVQLTERRDALFKYFKEYQEKELSENLN